MKHALLVAVIAFCVVPNSGCCLLDRLFCCNHWGCLDGGCGGGPPGPVGNADGHYGAHPGAHPGGPPTGTVSYPYYTNRGPRDFLAEQPRSVGP